jgi:hypothetical protein
VIAAGAAFDGIGGKIPGGGGDFNIRRAGLRLCAA